MKKRVGTFPLIHLFTTETSSPLFSIFEITVEKIKSLLTLTSPKISLKTFYYEFLMRETTKGLIFLKLLKKKVLSLFLYLDSIYNLDISTALKASLFQNQTKNLTSS